MEIGALLLGAAATVGFLLAPTPAPPAYRQAIQPSDFTQARQHSALWIGDAASAPAPAGKAASTFPMLACQKLDWVCNVDAQDGTGYLSDGRALNSQSSAYPARLDTDRTRFTADVVVVSGGGSDEGKPGLREAALNYLTALKAAYPGKPILVLEPFWPAPEAPRRVVSLRQAVRAAVDSAGSTWVPTADWLTPDLLAPDKLHLSDAGHARLAEKLLPVLSAVALPAST